MPHHPREEEGGGGSGGVAHYPGEEEGGGGSVGVPHHPGKGGGGPEMCSLDFIINYVDLPVFLCFTSFVFLFLYVSDCLTILHL